MGIDSIGGGGFKPPAQGDVATTGASQSGEGFRVDQAGAPRGEAAAAPESADVSSPDLERLRSGEISFDQYVDLRLDRALSHLGSRLDADQLSAVREQLRSQLSTDPSLTRLLDQATARPQESSGRS